jgi:hypothetical protein
LTLCTLFASLDVLGGENIADSMGMIETEALNDHFN